MQTGPGRRCRLRGGGMQTRTQGCHKPVFLSGRTGHNLFASHGHLHRSMPYSAAHAGPRAFDAGPGALHRLRPVRAECWVERFRCRTCALAAWPSVRDALGVQHGGPRAQCLTTASGCYGSREDILLSLFVSAQSARPAVLCEKQASHPLPKGNGALMRNGALML